MEKMRRLTKIGRDRTGSLSRKEKSNSKRHRSISATVSTSALPTTPTSHDPGGHAHQQFQLCYLGYVMVDEPRNPRDISAAVRNVTATTTNHKNVTILYRDGVLSVSDENDDRLILAPSQHVAVVTLDSSRNSYTDNSCCCIVIGFNNGRYKNQSHVFQAKSNREASDIVQALQKAFKASKGSSKSRKVSESSSTPKTKVEGQMGAGRRLNAMEDEDELIEHKPINSARRDSKRTIPTISRVSSEGTCTSSSLPMIASPLTGELPPPISAQMTKKKSGTRKSTAQRTSEREFTKNDKADALLNAIEKIVENNNLLREKCRVLLTPNTTFEEALITLNTGNAELLDNYLSSGRINADSADGSRNTLLHYAVAVGNIDIIRTICNNNADMEAAGWNDCRPLHRAIAEGNISVLQVLLQNGAQINGLDIMRRTPLHISSGKLELNECSIALVEQGAHIMATDVLGLRPYDLNPELKEIQNRLVTSACESFVAAKLITTHPSAGSLATPNSLSPTSTRPSSVASGSNLNHTHIDGCSDLDALVDQVSLRARLIAQAHKNKLSSRQPMSRSFANISELQDGGNAESAYYRRARLLEEQLKFSSEFGLGYPEVEGSAHLVMKRMDNLIQESKKLERRRGGGEGRRRWAGQGVEPEDQWEELDDMEMSLSEPNLIGRQDSGESIDKNQKEIVSPSRRPFSSSAALLQLSHPLSKVRADSGASQSSTGTLIEDEEEMEGVGEAAGTLKRTVVNGGSKDTIEHNMSGQPLNSSQPDASPIDIRRQERNSIFDKLISQLNEVSEELDHPLSSSSDRRSSSVEGVASTSDRRSSSVEGGASNSPEKRASQEPEMIDLDEISEMVDLDDVIDAVDSDEMSTARPASTISEQADMFSSLPRPPQPRNAVSRTVSLSSATMPSKKSHKGKWLHRVGSPLLKSRKSFTTGSPNSKRRRGNKVKELKEEGEGGEGGERASEHGEGGEERKKEKEKEKGSRRLFARKRSLPEIHSNSASSTPPATTPTFQHPSSGSDNFPPSESSAINLYNQLSNQLPKQPQQRSPLLPPAPPISHQAPPTVRPGSRQGDPVANSLDLMVKLSRNKECLSTLVSYICMPKCETRLRQLSQESQTGTDVLKNIATLMTNIYDGVGGGEGKKTALQSGVLDLTVKLLQGRDPIPGTCLSLLNGLLLSEDDSDFLRTIVRIPSKPLLHYLEPIMGDVVSESDSGIGNLRRDTLMSATARSSSDASNQVTQDEGVAGVGPARLEVPVSAIRTSSINSELSESSYSGRSLASPTLQGSSVTNLEARRIVLKMLAVSSTHSKMQNELSNERALSLFADVISNDFSHENLTNGLITLANVAQNVASHELFFKLGLVEKFHSSLVHGPRPRYHASRALVYLGKLEMLKGISLFEPIATGYETDVMIQTTDSDGHEYARGATIEKCAEMLTGKLSLLWGGFSLTIGPLSPSTDKITPKATKEQIINFFLTMYKSFIHPLVFVRLLRHRLAHPDPEGLFDWSIEDKSSSSSSPNAKTTPTSFIPPEQLNVFKLIGRWMEAHPDDFIKYPLLQVEVEQVISRLRSVRGAYLPHTHRLKSLLQDVNRSPSEAAATDIIEEKRDPHHENLYKLCKQMVIGGHLPVTSDEAVYLGSLQMHIEELALSSQEGGPNTGSLTKGRKATSRIKSAFPPGYTKSKQLLKRIQSQIQEFDKLSDRNSKHRYIERCQGNPGYDCTFFNVRVPSGGRFKKSGVSKQLLGISSKKVVFLHEKSKELLLTHPLASVLNVTREPESSTLIFTFRGDMTEFKVQVESPSHAWEMVNVLEQCKGDRMSTEETVRWSESLPSLFTMSVEPRLDRRDSLSDESSNEKTDERGATPPGPALSNDVLKSSLDPDYSHLEPLSSNGLIDSTPSRKPYHGDGLSPQGKEPSDDVSLVEEKAVFCDCPPDPELPQGFNLQHIVLTEMLSYPLEVARQMTLIAHERFCAITAIDLLEKVNLIPKRSSKVIVQRDSRVSNHSGQSLSLSFSDIEQQETNIEKLAYRFNQVGNWVANCILQFETAEERADTIDQFISIAQHCFDLRNYGSMMAIVVAGLGSAPIRRLHQSWAGVPKERRDLFKDIDTILDSKSNYKRYRESLGMATTPCVPYVGVFLKDLTFICDGNPDYLRGGLINLHKRRQVYKKLQEVHHFQQDHYKLHRVPELSQYLLSHRLVAEDDLHSLSQTLEPRIKRSQSQTSTRVSSTGSQKGSFFKSISGRSSLSSSNLNKV